MPRGEILSLRWDQVKWREGLIRLNRRQTKAKRARLAPLYGDLRSPLEMAFLERDQDCAFIVSWEGRGIVDPKTAWRKAGERAGVPEVLVHDLRRTAARNMMRAGVPEKQVMEIVGWKTRAMFDRYHIIDERDAHTAGEKMRGTRSKFVAPFVAVRIPYFLRTCEKYRWCNEISWLLR